MKHYRNLDFLRAFAVLCVLISHIWRMLAADGIVPQSVVIGLSMGRFGVILFFFHTSFVLMQSIESAGTSERFWMARFYIRRAFRIYPLAIVTVVAAWVLRAPASFETWPAPVPATAKNLVANLLLCQNLVGAQSVIGVLWTLPIEIEMYVLLPFVFLLLWRPHWRATMSLALVLSAIVAAVCNYLTGHMNLLAFTGCFLSGCISYRLSRGSRNWPAAAWLACVLAATGLGVLFSLNIAVEWLTCFLLAFTFPFVRDLPKSWFTAAGSAIAKYSYGIYLTHTFALWLCFEVARGLFPNSAARVLGVLAVTAAASVLTFHVVEDPLIRTGKRVANGLWRTEEADPLELATHS